MTIDKIKRLEAEIKRKEFKISELKKSQQEEVTCSICKKKFAGLGNNPQPVKTLSVSDRCCDECDRSIVIPRRWKEANKEIN